MTLTKIGTDGVKDDAVTSDKVANSINSAIAANTAKTQTTINNNADNRVITGSGTANTLEGEANLTYNGTRLNVATGDLAVTGAEGGDAQLRLTADEGDEGADYWRLESKASNNKFNLATYASGAWVDKVTVDTSGRVLIGTTTEGDGLADNLTIADSSNCGLTIRGGTSSLSSIFFADGTGASAYVGQQVYNHADNSLKWIVNGSESMRILAGGGITFNGDTAAANALDDYEEGNWTPTWSFAGGPPSGFSYTTQVGKYVKVGTLVYIRCEITINQKGSLSGAGWATIASVPFQCAESSSLSIGFYSGFGSGSFMPGVAHLTTTEKIYIAQHNSGGYSQDLQHSHFNNGARIIIAGTYQSPS